MKLITLAVALASLACPMGLVVLHPSTQASLQWDGGGHPRALAAHAAQQFASR